MTSTVVRADKMAAGGDAIARIADGRIAFVRGALPGELVEVTIVQSKKDFVRAEVRDVIEPSVHRVQPPCPAHAAGCGGCTWQHVNDGAQLHLKSAVVIEALRRTGRLIDPVVDIGSAVPPWAYRTTLRLATGSNRLGLRGRHSHDVIELDGCPVSHPLLEDLLADIRIRGDGEVSLRVSAATGERSAWIVPVEPAKQSGPVEPAKQSGPVEPAKQSGTLRVELLAVPADVAVGAAGAVHEVVAGKRLRVSAASFFQSGPAAAELLVAGVRLACGDIGEDASIIDAYGGVGLFASALGGGRITVVEESESACADARVNLDDRRADIVCSSIERWRPRRADLVVADPSRSGLGRQAVAVLTATEARRIVVVSCDPVSLARDAGLLRESGYEHIRSTVYDLFPQTHHVEVITTFDRQQSS